MLGGNGQLERGEQRIDGRKRPPRHHRHRPIEAADQAAQQRDHAGLDPHEVGPRGDGHERSVEIDEKGGIRRKMRQSFCHYR